MGWWWQPFGYYDFAALHFQSTVGIDVQEPVSYEAGKTTRQPANFAPAVGVTAGYMPMRGRDYALGVEMRGQTAAFSERTEYVYSLILLAQLMK
ncbi:MAG: hypothetical protein H0T89_36725 [Deltaproteobacteria bacterium]|nr:hypothetical protein [Deltaproteobacteria bacterium]